MSYVQNVLSQVKEKNADQPEFIQAVTEVLGTLAPVFENIRNMKKAALLNGLSNRSGLLCSACRGWTTAAPCM